MSNADGQEDFMFCASFILKRSRMLSGNKFNELLLIYQLPVNNSLGFEYKKSLFKVVFQRLSILLKHIFGVLILNYYTSIPVYCVQLKCLLTLFWDWPVNLKDYDI